MERIIIHFENLVKQEKKTLWIDFNQPLYEFEKEFEIDENQYLYDRFFYCLELHSRLKKECSWKENHVLHGDHIIYV